MIWNPWKLLNKATILCSSYSEELLIGIEIELSATNFYKKFQSINYVEGKSFYEVEIQQLKEIINKNNNWQGIKIVDEMSQLLEIISLDIHKKEDLLKIIHPCLKFFKKKNFVAAPSCGIHLSINRETQQIIKRNLGKFAEFLYELDELIILLSGRAPDKYNFCSTLQSFNLTTKNNLVKEIKNYLEFKPNADKFIRQIAPEAISLDRTFEGRIELRWFASTTKINDIQAYIEFIDSIFNYLDNNSIEINITNYIYYVCLNKHLYKKLIKKLKKLRFFEAFD